MDARQKHAGMTDSRHPVSGYINEAIPVKKLFAPYISFPKFNQE